MATARVRKDRGWVDNGKRRDTCRCGCGAAVPEGRRTFVSDQCVDRWRIQTDPGYVRRKVEERDRGVCGRCGVDTVALGKIIWRLDRRDQRRALDLLHIPSHRTTFWDADHIVAVVEGGGLCGLENYRTLCCTCHHEVTAELRARLRTSRRKAVQPPLPLA